MSVEGWGAKNYNKKLKSHKESSIIKLKQKGMSVGWLLSREGKKKALYDRHRNAKYHLIVSQYYSFYK